MGGYSQSQTEILCSCFSGTISFALANLLVYIFPIVVVTYSLRVNLLIYRLSSLLSLLDMR